MSHPDRDALADLPASFGPAICQLRDALGAGERGVVLRGPFGCGATMLARRVPLLMPEPSDHERRWLAAEFEGAGFTSPESRGLPARPFRAPHHSVSATGLTGGVISLGLSCACHRDRHPAIRAGELQLARFGVLMLDEVTEFRRPALADLAGAARRMTGAPFLVATAAPCLCGRAPGCACTPQMVSRGIDALSRAMAALDIGRVIDLPALAPRRSGAVDAAAARR